MKGIKPSVLILHHAVPAMKSGQSAASDAGVLSEVDAVREALKQLGISHRVAAAARLHDIPPLLHASRESVVFNLVENFEDGSTHHAMQVPTLCEAFGKACTGNDSASQTLCLNKWRTKGVLKAAGQPVPDGILVSPGTAPQRRTLPPAPWIVKPLSADASEGIHRGSVISGDLKRLAGEIRHLHTSFRQPALVESFFGCRELNVAILQKGDRLQVLPVSEIEFRNFGSCRPRIVDYRAKWSSKSFEFRNTVRVVPAPLPPKLEKRIAQSAVTAWQSTGCRDYARVDFRMDERGEFVILEVNPNPDISPDSGFAASLHAAGVDFRQFVECIVDNAMSRLPSAGFQERHAPRKRQRQKKGHNRFAIRRTNASDRDAVLSFMRDTGFFHEGEMEIAREVLDEAIKGGASGHYQSFTLQQGGIPVGWICFGPTPCTIGTFDLYWIGVCPRHQGCGYGRALLLHAEREMRRRSGKLSIIETSGRASYDSTRGFYLTNGYREVARIPDFYMPDDARVIYTKPLDLS